MRLQNTQPNTDRPNIVYILADDLGYGDVSCLNENSKIVTPHFDRLGAEGATFTDAHATSAVCTPSRYSILTGRYNWRTHLKKRVLGGYAPPLIETGRMTVASMLRAQGYHTACIGKWHLGLDWAGYSQSGETPEYEVTEGINYSVPFKNGPNQHGFEYFFGISASLDMPPYVYIENDHVVELPDHDVDESAGKEYWRRGPAAPDFRHADVLPRFTEKVLSTIDRWADAPFFIYFPLPAPHTPILPSAQFVGKTGTNAYGDFVLMCDDVIGQVIRKLEEKGIADNTIVVFTSDNGCSPMADFPELAQCGHSPSYVFRGHKSDIYEGGHRIPLLVRWPRAICPGTRVTDTVCLVDLMATLAEIVGYRLPDNAGEDSVSNLAAWITPGFQGPIREATVHHSFDGSFSVRKGRWKLEMCQGSGGWSYPETGKHHEGLPPIQLYDLSVDVSEGVNVQDRHREVVAELSELLTQYIVNGRSTPGARQANTGGDFWEQLHWMRDTPGPEV